MSDRPMVLIVDDEPAMRKLLAWSCHQAGFQTTLVEDGLEALAHASSAAYHLIITDYKMPRMNGVEFCRQLRSYEGHKDTPIIMCSSALTELDTEALLQEVGLITFLQKPIDATGLTELFRASARPPA